MGGLYRLLKYRRLAVAPAMVGGTLAGNCLTVMVTAVAAVHFGSADPSVWFVQLAGPIIGSVIGSVIVAIVLLLSIAAIAMTLYMSAIAIQQVPLLARMPWTGLLLLVLFPLLLAVWNTAWVLAHVMSFAAFGGLVFFGLSGVTLSDFWLLRRQFIALEHLFVADGAGHYWFWGGFNWIAIGVVAVSAAAYLALLDPISLRAGDAFGFFGAALPVVLASSALYYLLARLIVIPWGRGGYPAQRNTVSAPVVRVGL
jgi:cytosine/uracil/thiamine/allantoin permease